MARAPTGAGVGLGHQKGIDARLVLGLHDVRSYKITVTGLCSPNPLPYAFLMES